MSNRLYPINSRYYQVPTSELELPDGRTATYLQRRFVPSPERFATMFEHPVLDGDRIDRISHRYYGDSEQFWKILDANGVLHPDEATAEIGRRIRIPLPEGIPALGGEDD